MDMAKALHFTRALLLGAVQVDIFVTAARYLQPQQT
jgi:hypothetical protein